MEQKQGKGAQKLILRKKAASRRVTQNMLSPGFSVDAGESVATSSVQGTDLAEAVCREADLGHNRPGFLTMGVLEEDPNTLTGSPCLTEDETTIPIRWDVKTDKVFADLLDVFKSIKFQVPPGSRAFIPISARNVPGCGPSLLFHFGQVTFEPIKPTGPRKKKQEGPKKGQTKPEEKGEGKTEEQSQT